MTPLGRALVRRIATTGPVSIADYMAECLFHPDHGYYSTREPFGQGGDFTTAPEISQMFGELLGLCLAQAWLDRGGPSPFALVELGPGRGTLMADILRATSRVPGFHEAARVHLVEASSRLRAVQRKTIAHERIAWHDGIGDLPDLPLFLIANEFFDALPIRQFVRDGGGWRERMVGAEGDRLVFGLAPPAPVAVLDHRLADTVPGEIVETCAPGAAIATGIGARIARCGGVGVIVDYGGWRSRGDTLQALRAHRYDDPLTHPGEADLTAHVDFEALSVAAAAAGAAVSPLVEQGRLLGRLGIAERAAVLAARLTGPALDSHREAHRRLTDPAQMGRLFKALALHSPQSPAPPGFA